MQAACRRCGHAGGALAGASHLRHLMPLPALPRPPRPVTCVLHALPPPTPCMPHPLPTAIGRYAFSSSPPLLTLPPSLRIISGHLKLVISRSFHSHLMHTQGRALTRQKPSLRLFHHAVKQATHHSKRLAGSVLLMQRLHVHLASSVSVERVCCTFLYTVCSA